MAFPPNSQMSALDLSALAGVTPEQLAIIARAMQSGALPFPPPPPPSAPAHPAYPPSSSQATGPIAPARPIAVQHQTANPQNGLVSEDIEMGSEEGEVDEDIDTVERSGPPEFLRPPPTGPRNRSTTPRNKVSRTEARRLASQAANNTSTPRARPAATVEGTGSRHSSVGSFLKAMLDAGYSHDQLATQVSNPEAFRKLTSALGLSVGPTSQAVSNPTPASQVAAQQVNAPKLAVAAKKPLPTKPGAPKDRSEYLAKLQAAKNKKSELPPNPVKPKPATQATNSPISSPPAQQSSSTAAANAKAAKDELLRKRLEAIMAAKAKKSAVASSEQSAGKQSFATRVEPSPVNGSSHGPGAVNLDALTNLDYRTPYDSDGPFQNVAVPSFAVASSANSQVKQPIGVSSPHSKVVTPELKSNAPVAFNGLPGLFMTATSSRPHSATQFQPSAQTPPAQHPVVIDLLSSSGAENSDTNTVAKVGPPQPLKPTTPQNRPFGRTRYVDEPLIIKISDDEDDDDDAMDISDSDEDSDPQPTTGRKSSSDGNAVQSIGQRPQLQRSQMSSAATPSVTTPSQDAYNKKLQQIELLKKQLAEREQRKRTKSNGIADGSTSVSVTSGAATPTSLPMASLRPTDNTAILSPPPVSQASGTAPPATLVAGGKTQSSGEVSNIDLVKQDKEYWQRRHDELKQQLRGNGAAGSQFQGLAQLSSETENGTSSPSAINALTHVPSSTAGDAPVLSENEPSSTKDRTPQPDVVSSDLPDGTSDQNLADAAPLERQHAEVSSKSEEEGDDLDDIYEQPASSSAPVTESDTAIVGPPVSTQIVQETQGQPDHDGVVGDESTDDDDDAMDTSDDSSTDSDGSASDDYEPELVADPPESIGDRQPAEEESKFPATNGHPTADTAVPDKDVAQAHTTSQISMKQGSSKGEEVSLTTAHRSCFLTSRQLPTKPEPFTPYESPLTRFKDFRYHKDFLSVVPGGYKSLTYSNQIDPMKELCPFEAGGVCNDPNCQYQHFRDMALSDNILLRALTTDHPPTKTPEDEQRWKAGLTEVIKELKTTNLGKQDVGLIAQRIAQYRRDFIADPTVTLRLD